MEQPPNTSCTKLRNRQSLSDFERKLAQDGNQLYIIAGAFGTGGTGRLGVLQSITNGKVNVPQMFWKVRGSRLKGVTISAEPLPVRERLRSVCQTSRASETPTGIASLPRSAMSKRRPGITFFRNLLRVCKMRSRRAGIRRRPDR
jgi:hypothetical protein